MSKTRIRRGVISLMAVAGIAAIPGIAAAADTLPADSSVQHVQQATPTSTAPSPGATGNAGLVDESGSGAGLAIALGVGVVAAGGALAARAAVGRRA